MNAKKNVHIADNRSATRITLNKDFQSFDAFVREYVTNVSTSGVFIRSDQPLPVGSLVNLTFNVFGHGVETIEGTGEVVRTEKEPSGMGVVFVEITSQSKVVMDRLLGHTV